MPSIRYRPNLRRTAGAACTVAVAAFLAGGGFTAGRYFQAYSLGLPPSAVRNAATPQGNAADFSLFWQAWNDINAKYYGKADDAKRVDGAISGMVASLGDPYTVYLPPSANSLFQSDLDGSFGGIGAELNVKDGQLTVVSALAGTPAEKAKLKGGDIITEIDGAKTAGMNFNDAVNKIRGEKGSQVALTIIRSGTEQPFKVTLVRDTITVKSVTAQDIGDGGSVAYIKVNEFGADTADALRASLQAAADGKKSGVIIDLRDNPGGYLAAAVRAIGMVLPAQVSSDKDVLSKRTAVLEKAKDGSQTSEVSSESPVWPDGKLVVLVNGGSASASEIFSGAMKDYGRAKLVGEKTFGKGSVQEVEPLANGGSVKVTVAKWFTPLGTGIDGTGIEPDVAVPLADDAAQSVTDAQVMKALELLK